ncbi:transcriptional regulator GcvA [Labrys sp. KB_33_2]|uniref:transcriptional regulator GcvA n=1 Tax=unclassified Labrys (in: a-proteobacteria) TaxID=2688601 RepID=UPI003EB93665
MSRSGAGLGALWTFAVAARHLSFAKAAIELDVTPAAVSSQIRAFEDRLGTRLFFRTSRSMKLTHAGEELLEATGGALRTIDEALHRAANTTQRKSFTVSSGSSFAAKWLVPRLPRFRQQFPDIDMRIDISDTLADFSRQEVDVAIRFGRGAYAGLRSDRLFVEDVFPICSPQLLHGPIPLREPNDLQYFTLIHLDWHSQDSMWPDWRMWLMAAKADKPDPIRGLHFSQSIMTLQAAVDGQGVALGNTSLVGDDLAAGRLVRPFDLSLKIAPEFAYHLVAPRTKADKPMIKAFRDWVLAEIASGKAV